MPPSLKNIARQWELPAIVVLAAMNIVVYWDYWSGVRVFTGKDFLTAFSVLLNFQTDCLRETSLPLWNPFMNFGYPFVEHNSNTLLFPSHLFMGIVTGSGLEIIQREMLLWMVAGGFGMYLCSREFGASRAAGLAAGACFMFCGQLTSLPHWHILLYNATCFPYFLLGYHRAARAGSAFSLLTALFVAFSIYGGHTTTAVLGIYIFAFYVLADSVLSGRRLFGLKFLAVTLAVAALLSLPKLAPIFVSMKLGPRMHAPASLHTKDPFNVINTYNFMSFLLPVKFYFSLYIGQLSIIVLAHAAVRRKLRIDALLLTALFFGWFLTVDNQGEVSLLRAALNVLPFMKLVRNEWLMWVYPTLFAILYISRYVDMFLNESDWRMRLIPGAAVFAAMSLVFFLEYNRSVYMQAYLSQSLILLMWFSVFLIRADKAFRSVFICLLLAAEFFIVFGRVNMDEPPVRQNDGIRFAVIDQAALSRSYRDDNSILFKFYAQALQDHLRPQVSASRNWPFLISGLGAADFINAYPEQYGNFIDSMNLKRFAGWWYNSQERFDFIRIKDSPLLAKLDGQPLYLFLDRQSGMPAGDISFDRISCSGFSFTVNAERPGMFLLRQMFDDRWNVEVDGEIHRPLLAEGYFMGVDVPSGQHRIEFAFRPGIFYASLGISLLTIGGMSIFMIFRRSAKKRSGHVLS